MPLVLVENERISGHDYDWKDITGARYHFPNGYRNKIQPGTPFVYYRGVHTAYGRRRESPEYFGFGIIGEVYRDPEVDDNVPKKNWKWFCDIVDYSPFPSVVPWKSHGRLYEEIPQNLFRNGVRLISDETYAAILASAGIDLTLSNFRNQSRPSIPPLELVQPFQSAEPLIAYRRKSDRGGQESRGSRETYLRRSSYAKEIGDHAENVVLKFLAETLSAKELSTLVWVAQQGLKPGWDIQYHRDGEIVAIEVKGTSGFRFTSIEMTAGEWKAACTLRERYVLCLVSDCLSSRPQIQCITGPSILAEQGVICLTPLHWMLEFIDPKMDRQA